MTELDLESYNDDASSIGPIKKNSLNEDHLDIDLMMLEEVLVI
jgi:hypothetical protein